MVQINQSELDEINKTFKKLADVDKSKTMKEFVDYVYDKAIERADKHTKTGAMMKAVFLHKQGNAHYVGVDKKLAPYALFVHWGTKPHLIKPNKRKALRWATQNTKQFAKQSKKGVFKLYKVGANKHFGFAFAKVIHHPGYKGDPFLTLALDDGLKKLPEFFNKLEKELK